MAKPLKCDCSVGFSPSTARSTVQQNHSHNGETTTTKKQANYEYSDSPAQSPSQNDLQLVQTPFYLQLLFLHWNTSLALFESHNHMDVLALLGMFLEVRQRCSTSMNCFVFSARRKLNIIVLLIVKKDYHAEAIDYLYSWIEERI